MSSMETTIEAVLEDPMFGTLKRYVIGATGLSYYEEKDRDLAAAIGRALKGASFDSARAYLALLSTPGHAELDRLVEELTIGETFFFRHAEMFSALREHVFPEIHARKQKERQMRIWSAGCSVGAEPYSLSILLKEELAHYFHDWSIEIIGTDINRRFLQMAREASYESWALRGMPEEMLQRCFQRQERKWVLNRRFTEGVTFQHHNLVRDRFPSLGNNLFALDLVICRNVMIYFSQATVRQLAEQFHQSLIPGGWLAVGHAEPHTDIFRAFRTMNAPGAILYQRTTAGEPPSRAAEEWFAHRGEPDAAPPLWTPPLLNFKLGDDPFPPEPEFPQRFDEPVPEECVGLDSVRRMADSGDLASALLCCEHLAVQEKLNPAVHFFHGLILEQSGMIREAHEALRRAIYLGRGLVLAHYHLGLIQKTLGSRARALRSFRNVGVLLGDEPDDAPVLHGDGLTAGDLRSLIAMQIDDERS